MTELRNTHLYLVLNVLSEVVRNLCELFSPEAASTTTTTIVNNNNNNNNKQQQTTTTTTTNDDDEDDNYKIDLIPTIMLLLLLIENVHAVLNIFTEKKCFETINFSTHIRCRQTLIISQNANEIKSLVGSMMRKDQRFFFSFPSFWLFTHFKANEHCVSGWMQTSRSQATVSHTHKSYTSHSHGVSGR